MCLALSFSPRSFSAQLAIVIDDIGNNYAQGNAIVELKGPLTMAFLPHTPYAKELAEKAFNNNKEVILHAPMENLSAFPLGPGALTLKLTKEEFQKILRSDIQSIPHVQGINNHMGSLLTQKIQPMNWLMETIKKDQLYFIDSFTSAKSIAYTQAIKHNIPALKRQVFLDNDKRLSALTRQWNQAIKIAKEKGHAILIGHPYDESHAFLKKQIPTLIDQGIELAPASQLFLHDIWKDFDISQDEEGKDDLHERNRYFLRPIPIASQCQNQPCAA